MTGPQVEDGYTRIANQLLEQILLYPFTKRQLVVLLAIIRKTYGYGKKSDDMTVSQIARITHVSRQHVSAAVSELESIGAVLKRDGVHGYVIGIQKDYTQWRVSQNGTCPETGQKVSQNGTKGVPKRDTQKITPKENTKESIRAFAEFWLAYPKKRSKGQAERAWQKLNPSAELLATMLDALEQQKQSADWQKDGGKFIPYPATWLNAKGWEDEITGSSRDRFEGVL